MGFSIFYRLPTLLLFFSGLVYPDAALPCSVCYTARPASLAAYYGTTLLMTLLPLTIALGLFWWFRHLDSQ